MRCYLLKVVALVAVSGTVLVGCARNFTAAPDTRNVSPAAAHARGNASAAAVPAAVPAAEASADAATGAGEPDPDRALANAVGPLARTAGGHLWVGVWDLATGRRATYGGGTGFDTASIVKADILATRLYENQRAHRGLSRRDRALAWAMMTRSDNTAASELWRSDGGTAGINAANRIFRLRQTVAGPGPYWGLTRTSAGDQVQILSELLTGRSVLRAPARNYARMLMHNVEPAQAWGVSAAADPRTRIEIKDGWLPNPSLWVINSIGEVIHHHQPLLLAVLSDDNPSEGSGIDLVSGAAERAAAAITRR